MAITKDGWPELPLELEELLEEELLLEVELDEELLLEVELELAELDELEELLEELLDDEEPFGCSPPQATRLAAIAAT